MGDLKEPGRPSAELDEKAEPRSEDKEAGINEVRREGLERLVRELEVFQHTFENAAVGIAHISKDGRLVRVNRKLCDIAGYTKDELQAMTFQGITHPEDLEEDLRLLNRLLRGEIDQYSLEKRYTRKDGSTVWVRVTASMQRPDLRIAIVEDITRRKETEQALQESERMFRSTFHDHSAVKLLIEPETGEIVEANRAAESFYGWSVAELKTMRIQEINTLPPELIRSEMEKANTLERTHFEFQHRLADGSTREVDVYSSRIRARGKELLHSVIHDITPRKVAERALHRAREELEQRVRERTSELRAESKRHRYLARRLVDVLEEDRLNLSMMLHDDIGQLVIGTKMQIENLKDALAKIDPRVPVRLDPILKSLQEIVSSLRNRSRQLRPSSLDTIGLAAALRSIDAGDNKCRVHCHAQEEPEGINPDLKLTVFRIAQEAVTNALKHAGCREIHLRLGMPKDDTLTLTVEDDGRGFSYDEMASDVKGLGPMGLLIMRERAVNAGGELRVESAPGRGTSVVAAFPVGTRGTVPGEPPLPA